MDREHMRRIGKLGAISRMKLHGNPGTSAGRILGGLRSIKTHKNNNTGFKVLKKIRFPRRSARLAELLGIMMGDGHVHLYQATICTNSETDLEHALYCKELLQEIFSLPVSLKISSAVKACTIRISSKEVCRFLTKQGIPQGSKILLGLTIPDWIQQDSAYRRAFLRGLVDTDGCVYEDKHCVKGKLYSSTCIAFTSASPELREFVTYSLQREGWSPSISGRDVRLRRKKDVNAYAQVVGFSNPKHARKIRV